MKTKHRYPDVQSNISFPEIEKEILQYWDEKNSFQESINQRAKQNAEEFVFYDGPPFANGLPHYGHLLTGFVKDTYARYQTVKGKKVERRFGWDCHGLPAEMGAEKELGFSGRSAITAFGIDKFNDHCKMSVMKYSGEWEKYIRRQARWVDFENSYKTMDINFMESVLWAFKELYKKGLIYQSLKVMPYSWACETALSNFETRLDNSYRQRTDKAVTVSFKLKEAPNGAPRDCAEYRIPAWTTTPWTLPSNLALAVGKDIEYSCVVRDGICYILGTFALKQYAKELDIKDDSIISTIKGSSLENAAYYPLFNYFKDHKNSFRILTADFVVEGDGTGIVHLAPGFGEDDQLICQKEGIEIVCPVDNSGKFTDQVYDFQGLQVFEANDPIIIKLKKQGNWIKTEQYIHNYPHCWRTDTPLIYKAVPSWYVKVTEFKDRMVELNKQINWIPSHVQDGLFGKWLENARDWSISRNRFWGTPIPVWQSDDPTYPRIDVYGSIEELEKDFAVKITDLHKPYIDNLVRPNPDDPSGKSMMRRVDDVFDCWFESGSMPYGQAHYPFENKAWFENHFPADFIVEYSAQTRGWFYTLMVLSTALFDRPPFLNCICHGVILDATGQKLSKRLNNYADPLEMFKMYGADALRVTMLSSPVAKGQELLIDKEGKMVFDKLRLFIKPIWNAYHFFCLYANIDKVEAEIKFTSANSLDKYILSKLKITTELVEQNMDSFDSQAAYQHIADFFEVLNNWYIRRSRNRFWKSQPDEDKISAYNTLYTCLITMMKVSSSLLPLISEHIYMGLTQKDSSVHLTDYPKLNGIKTDHELVNRMDRVLSICSAALFIRSSENIRVRQPLASIRIVSKNARKLQSFEELIKEEINVKEVIYTDKLSDYADQKLSINFPALGRRIPAKIKEIIAFSKQNNRDYENGKLIISGEELLPEEYNFTLIPKDSKGTKALSDNQAIIKLDTNITPELEQEGTARDIIRILQQARKEAGFEVSDRINVKLGSSFDLNPILAAHRELITEQTLSKLVENINPLYSTSHELADGTLHIELAKS